MRVKDNVCENLLALGVLVAFDCRDLPNDNDSTLFDQNTIGYRHADGRKDRPGEKQATKEKGQWMKDMNLSAMRQSGFLGWRVIPPSISRRNYLLGAMQLSFR